MPVSGLRRPALDAAKGEENVARGKYEQALSAIPEDLREPVALDAELGRANTKLEARQKGLQEAVDAETAAREAALRAASDEEAAKAEVDKAKTRREAAAAAFQERLEACDLTEPVYQSLKPAIETIVEDGKAVEAFRTAREAARMNRDVTALAVAGSARPDLAPLEASLEGWETAQKKVTGERAEIGARLAHLENLRREIAEELAKLKAHEEKTAALRDLAALFNAVNGMKLDLETYAISAMFEYVLRAANQRLDPMTNGRYRLERDDGVGGRARRGLGIVVLDSHTGKSRPTATLSGGETFIAALALALGLSDVVEGVNGKIHLDTIFIDEGFGSLDTENDTGTLDQVLQVLNNLVGQRRTVGLISQVQIVQENIPNGFYVRKGLHGSRIEVRAG